MSENKKMPLWKKFIIFAVAIVVVVLGGIAVGVFGT